MIRRAVMPSHRPLPIHPSEAALNLTFESKLYRDLIREFAEHAGLDPDGLFLTQEIRVDNLPIGLQLDGDEELGDVLLFTSLGKPAEPQWAHLARLLLEANHCWFGTGGATLAAQPDTGNITLWARVPLPGLDGAALAETLDSFADVAHFWREQVSDQGAQSPNEGNLATMRVPFDPMLRV